MTRSSRLLVRLGCLLLLLIAVCGAMYATRVALLPGLFHWLDVGRAPCRADCALVLGGDENSRPFVAAALWKAGFIKKVCLTKVKPAPLTVEEIYPPCQEISRKVLLARGVDATAIELLGQDLATTFDEAQALRAYVERSEIRRILLVTNDYHTRRSRWVFQRALEGTGTELIVISAPTGYFTADDWWQSSLGFRAVLSEYCKLAFYRVRYGNWGYALMGTMVALAVIWEARRHVKRPQPLRNAPVCDAPQK